ncbi:hypothetical protein [Rhizobium leguminosarum]|nr:hypothetical protein [Rhizobium leguminosarum]TBY24089.1 hypothetical protein E0H30_09330 [Rhizobium leguminosarum bv. viciae]TBY93531.1 hypothetical protein E0H49_31550 [Rhizobium leguminosarum bv. viciae]
MIFQGRRKVFESHVFVVDALGFSDRIRRADRRSLLDLWGEVDRQYAAFKLKLPNLVALQFGSRIIGTREFETLRLNDMFIVHSRREMPDPALRYLVTACVLYQQMLALNYIPRGGLGFGDIVRGAGLLVGGGFLDAYDHAEKRPSSVKDICAIAISPRFMATIGHSKKALRLVCFYEGHFFLHPYHLVDPDLGPFSPGRVLDCLEAAETNEEKLNATRKFLAELEDYDAAMRPGSSSEKFAKSRS